jgi:hypothetical protein
VGGRGAYLMDGDADAELNDATVEVRGPHGRAVIIGGMLSIVSLGTTVCLVELGWQGQA